MKSDWHHSVKQWLTLLSILKIPYDLGLAILILQQRKKNVSEKKLPVNFIRQSVYLIMYFKSNVRCQGNCRYQFKILYGCTGHLDCEFWVLDINDKVVYRDWSKMLGLGTEDTILNLPPWWSILNDKMIAMECPNYAIL